MQATSKTNCFAVRHFIEKKYSILLTFFESIFPTRTNSNMNLFKIIEISALAHTSHDLHNMGNLTIQLNIHN